MKIAQICPSYYPSKGGVPTHVKEISQRLSQKGFDVEVLTTRSEVYSRIIEDEMIDGVRVRRFNSFAPSQAYFFSSDLRRYIVKNSQRYDLVHAHCYSAFPALYAAEAKSKNRFVFTPHYHEKTDSFLRNLLHFPYKQIAKKIFDRADRVVCVSHYEKRLIMTRFKIDEAKLVLIPNGIDLKELDGLRKRDSGRNILCVSRLKKYKGIEYLIEAVARLGDNTCLDIVGVGGYEKTLISLARRLGIPDKIRFYHDLPREALLQRYASADLFVLLSKQEAFGISVAEALASGIPCIVANSSALIEWVDNSNCYGISYPISINELARLIDKVIGKKIEKPKLSTWDEATKQLLNLYMETA
jgi:glycosyltransferase involved in cell wall biosynthesis